MTKLRFGPFIFSLKYGYFKKLEGCPLQFWAKRFCVSNGQLQESSDTSFQCYAQWVNITRASQDKLGWHCCSGGTHSALCLQNIYEQLIKLQLSHNWAVTFCDSVFWNFIVQALIYDTLNIIKSKNWSQSIDDVVIWVVDTSTQDSGSCWDGHMSFSPVLWCSHSWAQPGSV